MHLTNSTATAIPITPIAKATLPQWLDTHSAEAAWVSETGFSAEPGSFTFIPDKEGRPGRVLAAPNEGEPVWAFANLPMSLPEATYTLDHPFDDQSATSAALGWALGSYEFAAYRTPKRAPPRLVWPENADRDEVVRIGSAVNLARDLINTPAEDMGPDQLVSAGEKLARETAAQVRVVRGEVLLRDFPCVHAVGRASPARRPCSTCAGARQMRPR